MRAFFFGSGKFPLPILKQLHKVKTIYPKVTLITVPNKSHKEKNEIKDYAQQQQFQVYQPNLSDKNHQFLKEISDKPDIGIVCNYGYMIPSEIIDIFTKGLYVIHPSLLPKYRGAAPIQRALMNNESQTGVSYIEISKNKQCKVLLRFDAGSILLQRSIQIEPTDRYMELQSKLSMLCAESIEEFIINLDNWPRIPQKSEETTKAPKLNESHQKVNFNKSAQEVYNQFRGIYGTNLNSLKLKYQSKEFYLDQASLVSDQEATLLSQYNAAQCGSIWLLKSKQYRNYFYIKFHNNTWLRVEAFRFLDRGTAQGAYTFKDQFLKQFKFDSLENNFTIE